MIRHPVLFVLAILLFAAGLIHDGEQQRIAQETCEQTYSAEVCQNLLR